MHVSAIFKGPVDQIGRRKVYIKIIINNKRTFRATMIKVDPKFWKEGKVVSDPNSANINAQIKSLILSYEQGYVKPVYTFHAYALKCLENWEHTKRGETKRQLQSKINKFKECFSGNIDRVTPEVLNKYVAYCFSLGNKENTVWSSLKCVRVIITQAFKEGLIKENPFRQFSMPKYRDPAKIYLTKEQVDAIEKFSRENPDYRMAAGWFVISCYTGLRFSDQVNFNKSKIRAGRLIVYTTKTGQVVSIKMTPKLKELFTLVDHKPMPYTNEHYNRYLKAIAAECGITEKLSAHTGRHTFGTLCASAGISQEVTAKLMGHNSIRTTAIYYQLTSERIDSELEKIF